MSKRAVQKAKPRKNAAVRSSVIEAEVVSGLERIAQDELRSLLPDISFIKQHNSDTIQFNSSGSVKYLSRLKTVIAIYKVVTFNIPRPKALLGHQHFHRLLDEINEILKAYPYGTFQNFHISMAGSDSSVMKRVQQELEAVLDLPYDPEAGDLLLRIRRTSGNSSGWEVLIRTTSRPLATRDWRVCNFQGALNASVAHAMIRMTQPDPDDNFVNLCCGSGTFAIERSSYGRYGAVIACDTDIDAICCAKKNVEASIHDKPIHLIQSDVKSCPLPDSFADAICVDLPFGILVGSHQENEYLYPALLKEAARITKPQAKMAAITPEIQLMDRILRRQNDWKILKTYRISLSGLQPCIYLLGKREN